MTEVYLDNNATTQPLPEVVRAMARAMSESHGNPSSPHARGRMALQQLQEARASVAGLVGCAEEGLIFTSGGTEANNLVLRSLCGDGAESRLITSAVEHSSVLKCAEWLAGSGVRLDVVGVDDKGRISLTDLERKLEQPASLVSIQWANSETGTVQPIEQMGELCARKGVPLHVDAAQAVGRIPIDMSKLPVDYLTITAHKIHGPQGVGAVAAKSCDGLVGLLHGGDQEGGIRPGTENLPGIVGFGKAAKIRHERLSEHSDRMRNLRDKFEQQVLGSVPGATVNGDVENRTVNSTNIMFPDVDGMAMMANLDGEGVQCSLTSACVSSRPEPSHVLLAMGLTEDEAYGSLRFSFSVLNTEAEAEFAAGKVAEVYRRLAAPKQSASAGT